MTTILHITAHLGGGVGKALSGLVEQSNISNSEFKHSIVCLEQPEKKESLNKIIKYRGEVTIQPTVKELEKLMESSDIVQLEWWNHPTTIKYLCNLSDIPIRLVTWYHNSGLDNSIIPKQLMIESDVFLLTSHCSLQCKEIKETINKSEYNVNIGVVYSSGGFSEFPKPERNITHNMSVGYFGSLNFSKLHPQYINYLSTVSIPNFSVKIIGDITTKENSKAMNIMKEQCNLIGNPELVQFTGYVPDIVSELKSINVLAYLLNPEHYGTAENALLESMSMGIVPVVLDNPAERCIVDDYETGFIINNTEEFSETIQWLYKNPEEREEIGKRASKSVRKRFSIEKTESQLNGHYKRVMLENKREINFRKIFQHECQDD